MSRWLGTTEVSNIYDLSIDTLNQFVYNNKGDNKYVTKDGKYNLFDVEALEENQHRRLQLWNLCHENYYILSLDYNMTDVAQVEELLSLDEDKAKTTWAVYLSTGMWHPLYDVSILSMKTSSYLKLYGEWSTQKIKELINPFNMERHTRLATKVRKDTNYMIREECKRNNKLLEAA